MSLEHKYKDTYVCIYCNLISWKYKNINRKYCSVECKNLHQRIKYKGKNNPNFGNMWNDEQKNDMSHKAKQWISKKGHPKGMKGKYHSERFRKNHSALMSGEGNSMYGRTHTAHTKKMMSNRKKELIKMGWRPVGNKGKMSIDEKIKVSNGMKSHIINNGIDAIHNRNPNVGNKKFLYCGVYYRSHNEIVFAKFLDEHNIKFQYEKELFYFENDGEKILYAPDFYLSEIDVWVELKLFQNNDKKVDIFRERTKNTILLLNRKTYKNVLSVYGDIIAKN